LYHRCIRVVDKGREYVYAWVSRHDEAMNALANAWTRRRDAVLAHAGRCSADAMAPRDWDLLLLGSDTRLLRRHERVVDEGGQCRSVFIVIDGSVAVYKNETTEKKKEAADVPAAAAAAAAGKPKQKRKKKRPWNWSRPRLCPKSLLPPNHWMIWPCRWCRW
jgi:hypothetical protein